MSEGFQIALADLKEWLQEETAPIIKPLKDKGKRLLKEIRSRLEDVRENGDKLFEKSDREVQKGSSKTYRCAKTANKLSKNISSMISKVAVPDDISYENFQLLIGDLEKTFGAIDHERRVWYRRISPYFILDRRRLDIAIKRTQDTSQELRSFLSQKYVKAKNAENMLDMIDRLFQLTHEAEDIKERKSQAETRIELLEKEMQKKEQKIGLIQDKAELVELSTLERRINDLKVKVKYHMRHLQKPFFKIQSLARSARVALPPDEVRKLEQYMKAPFEALTSEKEGHPVLKSIVQKVEDAIRQGKLKLKTARLRKAREQIGNILKKDSLTNLHHDCLGAISRRNQLLISETVAATQRELKQLQATLQKLQTQKESVESSKRVLEEKHQRTLKKIETQKNELEHSIFELIDKRVHVVFRKSQ